MHWQIAKSCLIIDIAIPGDQNIIVKEQEKIEKYQDLQKELGKLWKLKAEIVPVVVGAFSTISHNLKFYLKNIDIPIVTSCLQKTAILETTFILRRVLGISEFRQNSEVKLSYPQMRKEIIIIIMIIIIIIIIIITDSDK